MKLSHVTKTIAATDARSNDVATEKQRWCLTVTQRLTAYRRTIRFVQRNVNFLLRRTVCMYIHTNVCMCVRTYSTYKCMYVCMYVYM